MRVEVDPKETSRASAYELWMQAPNPMVTFFKTMDVTELIRTSRKRNLKFNMLMDYCIGKAASSVKEFYLLPVGDKLMRFDTIAVNTIVKNRTGEVSSCDILLTDDLEFFNREYLEHTGQVAETCVDLDLSSDSMVIGTSAIIDTEIDGAVGMNSGIFNNPFMIWGKYRKNFSDMTCRYPSSSITRRWMELMQAGSWKTYRRKSIDQHIEYCSGCFSCMRNSGV